MKRKNLEYPPRDPRVFKGAITSWNMRDKATPRKGRYCVRFDLWFSDGTSMIKECGGFKTRSEALSKKHELIGALTEHKYVAFEIRVKDYFPQWLYYHMIDEVHITYATYMSYKNIVYNYIIPKIGTMWLSQIKTEDILSVLDSFSGEALLNMGYSVFGGSFRYAKQQGLIPIDLAYAAIKRKREQYAKEKQNAAAKEINPDPFYNTRYALSSKQIYELLYLAKTKEPELYLPLLIACTTGCRISELIALRFCDVDFQKKEIHITGQLSRPLNISNVSPEEAILQHAKTKSRAGIRRIPVPDFVLDEIVLAKERYGRDFPDMDKEHGYLWYQKNGKPHNRGAYKKPFGRLKKELELPQDLHWHDLRHTFATLMAENEVNLKELATVLGHRTGEFTLKVYVKPRVIIEEGIHSYFNLLTELTGIQIKEDRILYPDEIAPEMDGYLESFDTFIRNSSGYSQKNLSATAK